jgi:hypothetical protein
MSKLVRSRVNHRLSIPRFEYSNRPANQRAIRIDLSDVASYVRVPVICVVVALERRSTR